MATSVPSRNPPDPADTFDVMDFMQIELGLRQSPLFQALYEVIESGNWGAPSSWRYPRPPAISPPRAREPALLLDFGA